MKTTTRKLASSRAVDLRRMHRPPTHPGEMLLEEFLKPLGLSQTAAAARMQMTTNRLNEIVKRKRGVTADTARRLTALLGHLVPGLAQVDGLGQRGLAQRALVARLGQVIVVLRRPRAPGRRDRVQHGLAADPASGVVVQVARLGGHRLGLLGAGLQLLDLLVVGDRRGERERVRLVALVLGRLELLVELGLALVGLASRVIRGFLTHSRDFTARRLTACAQPV